MQVSLDPHCYSVAAVGFGKRAAYSAKDGQIARVLFLRSAREGAKHQRMTEIMSILVTQTPDPTPEGVPSHMTRVSRPLIVLIFGNTSLDLLG